MTVKQQLLIPTFGRSLRDQLVGMFGSALVGYWVGDERSGTTIKNYEGNANKNGSWSGVSLAGDQFLNGHPTGLWDGTNDYGYLYSTALNADFDGTEGSMGAFFKVANAGVWTDTTERHVMHIFDQGTDFFRIIRSTTNNRIVYRRRANGTFTNVDTGTWNSTDWLFGAMSWSEAADELKAYKNNAQHGTTQTGIDNWTGDGLDINACAMGAANRTPTDVWSGSVAHGFLLNRPITLAEVQLIWNSRYD